MATTTTFLLQGGMVLPCEGRKIHHDPGSVLVVDGRIAAVGSVEEVSHHPAAGSAEVLDVTGHAVIPGLHNCHLHSGLLRGTAESMSLWDWLETYVDPAHKALTPEIAEAASCDWPTPRASASAPTSVMDMWRFMEGSARAAEAIGIRATLVPYVADRPGYDYFETLETNRRLLETHRKAADGRVRAWVGSGAPLLLLAADVPRRSELGRGVRHRPAHPLAPSRSGRCRSRSSQFGRRPIEEFYNRGILGAQHGRRPLRVARRPGDRAAGADRHRGHALPVLEHEALVRARPASATSARPASTVGARQRRREGEQQPRPARGDEVRLAAAEGQRRSTRPSGDPWDILDMATLAGARALGLADDHRLARGRQARPTSSPSTCGSLHFAPVLHGADFNVPAHLVFSASGHDVADVWVDGRQLVEGGQVISVDVTKVATDAQAAAEELFERRRQLQGATPSPATTLGKNA